MLSRETEIGKKKIYSPRRRRVRRARNGRPETQEAEHQNQKINTSSFWEEKDESGRERKTYKTKARRKMYDNRETTT